MDGEGEKMFAGIIRHTHTRRFFIKQFLVIVKTNDPIFVLSIKPIKR